MFRVRYARNIKGFGILRTAQYPKTLLPRTDVNLSLEVERISLNALRNALREGVSQR